jgi:hypothetical protein
MQLVKLGHAHKIISFYGSIKPVDPNCFNRPANTTCLGNGDVRDIWTFDRHLINY